MKVGFTGTRKGMTPVQLLRVGHLLDGLRPQEVHHGDCIGADKQFNDMVYKRIRCLIHPPENDKYRAHCKGSLVYPAKPYIDRNHDIVDETDMLIAAPAQPNPIVRSGTWSTVRYARQRGKFVILVKP